MLTTWDRLKLCIGYLGLRINHCNVESATKWADFMRGYYELYNKNASDEVLNHYLDEHAS